MMRNIFFIGLSFLLILAPTAMGQEPISLPNLLRDMATHNKLYLIPAANDSASSLALANIRTAWLPKVDLRAEAQWQSDVTSLNISIPSLSVPSPDKDMYQLVADVSQLIWDGGSSKQRMEQQKKRNEADRNIVQGELYSLKEQVVALYFGCASLQMSIEQVRLMILNLDARLTEVEAGVKAGALLESDVNPLMAERLRLQQNLDAYRVQKSSLVKSLVSLTGVVISQDADIQLPMLDLPEASACQRPDMKQFELQKEWLESSSKLTQTRRMPVLSAFARAGYGKPGLNMLSNELNAFALVGARLSWNIWDWNSTSRERQSIRIRQDVINFRHVEFEKNYNWQIASSHEQLLLIQRQIIEDEKIVELLEKTVRVSASQLKNGAVTPASYLIDFNNLLKARIEGSLRGVKLSHEMVKLYLLMGIELYN